MTTSVSKNNDFSFMGHYSVYWTNESPNLAKFRNFFLHITKFGIQLLLSGFFSIFGVNRHDRGVSLYSREKQVNHVHLLCNNNFSRICKDKVRLKTQKIGVLENRHWWKLDKLKLWSTLESLSFSCVREFFIKKNMIRYFREWTREMRAKESNKSVTSNAIRLAYILKHRSSKKVCTLCQCYEWHQFFVMLCILFFCPQNNV